MFQKQIVSPLTAMFDWFKLFQGFVIGVSKRMVLSTEAMCLGGHIHIIALKPNCQAITLTSLSSKKVKKRVQ